MTLSCPSDETLARFDEGALPEAERAAVLRHIESCTRCREVIAVLVRARQSRSGPGAPEPDVLLARYRVESELGRGAFGRVYLALDQVLGRKVALKVVPNATSDAGEQVMRESRAVARLNHPNVITLHDVALHEGSGFLSMEYLDGGNLAQWLATPRALPDILRVFTQAAQGLAAAHRAGLIHRDFKPANVLLGTDGRVCVSDFGLARVSDDPMLTSLSSPERTLIGTPAYMAPEQLEGEALTAAADQFSFFVALHEAVTGVRPFAGASVDTLRQSIREGRRKSVDRPLPTQLAPLLDRGLQRAPSARFASMDEVARLLAALSRPSTAHRWVAVAAALGVLAVAGAGLMKASPPQCPPLTGREAVWTAPERVAVAQALASAPEVSQQVLAALDESATQLDVAWAESCAAARPVAQTARQQLCLTDVLTRLEIAAQMLASVPQEAAPRVLPVVRSLPEPRSCAALERYTERVPAPTSEPARTLVRSGHVLLLEAETLRRLGRFPEALERTVRAKSNAERAGYAWLKGDALRMEARLHNNVGDYELAEKTAQEALEAARNAGDALLLGQVAFTVAFIECTNLMHAAHCEAAQKVLEDCAAREPLPELLAAAAELRSGIAEKEFDVSRSLRESEVALQQWRQVPLSTEEQLRTRSSLVTALGSDLQRSRALEEQQALVKDAAHYWGADHRRTLQIEAFESWLLVTGGRIEDAERVVRRQYERMSALVGPESIEAIDLLAWSAAVAEARGKPGEGLALRARAYAVRPELSTQWEYAGVLARVGRRAELAALGRKIHEEFDERKAEPSVGSFGFAVSLTDVYHRDDAALRGLLAWMQRALAARSPRTALDISDLEVDLLQLKLAIRSRDLRTARDALERAEAFMKGRQDARTSRTLALARAKLMLAGSSWEAAAAAARSGFLPGFRDDLEGQLHLALGEALVANPVTRAEGCAELKKGLELMEPWKGIDVRAQRALAAKCPAPPRK